MAATSILKQRSTFTSLAVVCFAAGLVLMFIALYRESSPLTAAAGLILLAATIACWVYSTYCEST